MQVDIGLDNELYFHLKFGRGGGEDDPQLPDNLFQMLFGICNNESGFASKCRKAPVRQPYLTLVNFKNPVTKSDILVVCCILK